MKAWLVVEPKPAPELLKEGLENAGDLIAYCARVSNPTNEFNTETGERLIRYLIKHKHWSPLEMCSATVGVETTRDIARQLLRHRSFSFQEFSQRYSNPNDLDDTFVLRAARLQDTTNRQNSIECFDLAIIGSWIKKQQEVIDKAKEVYNWAIENGIAKEQARAVLPEGNTKSKLYMNGTLRSYVHYLELRTANGTQREHIELARAVGEAISKIFPMAEEFIQDG
jgi:thymidylate synthase (FAD)